LKKIFEIYIQTLYLPVEVILYFLFYPAVISTLLTIVMF